MRVVHKIVFPWLSLSNVFLSHRDRVHCAWITWIYQDREKISYSIHRYYTMWWEATLSWAEKTTTTRDFWGWGRNTENIVVSYSLASGLFSHQFILTFEHLGTVSIRRFGFKSELKQEISIRLKQIFYVQIWFGHYSLLRSQKLRRKVFTVCLCDRGLWCFRLIEPILTLGSNPCLNFDLTQYNWLRLMFCPDVTFHNKSQMWNFTPYKS